MKNLVINGTKILGVGFALALASGCATRGYVDQRVAEVQRTADSAQSAASAASAKADQAAAQAAAAKQAADKAMQCCLETNEKIDRMFQRSMQK